MKKALALMLLSALLLSSCGRTVTDSPAVTDGTDSGIIFKDADFGGAEFKFLTYGSNDDMIYDCFICADDEAGKAVSSAVIQRNSLTEDKYKVRLTAEECDPAREAEKRMLSGQIDFSVIYDKGSNLRDLALNGKLYDLKELGGADSDASYRSSKLNEGLTVEGRLFMAASNIYASPTVYPDVYFFNKAMVEEFTLTSPYDYVDEGSWTYDKVYEMTMAVQKDLNDDGEMTSLFDRFGGISGADILYGMCDVPLTEKDEDGKYGIIPYTEDMVAAYQEYKPKLDRVEELDFANSPSMDPYEEYSPFRDGRALFFAGCPNDANYFNDKELDYGIVPTPARIAGDGYSCSMAAATPLLSVPAEVKDPEMTAWVLDYMAYESDRLLIPAYSEAVLGKKTAENEKEHEMLELIRNSATYDWVDVYMYDSDILTFREKLFTSYSLGSVIKRYVPALVKELNDTVAKITAAGKAEAVTTE